MKSIEYITRTRSGGPRITAYCPGNDEGPRRAAGPFVRNAVRQAIALTSSGMPGPNVVDTAPFWM
jgi:hypothetical protein